MNVDGLAAVASSVAAVAALGATLVAWISYAEANSPNVVVRLEIPEDASIFMALRISNLGNSAAYKIKLSLRSDLKNDAIDSAAQRYPFRGIDFLLPQESIVVRFLDYEKILAAGNVRIEGSFFGRWRKRKFSFELDATKFEGAPLTTSNLKAISKKR